MGKSKQNKTKNRHKPTGMMSVQEAEEKAKETECDLKSKTLPILEKLNCLEDRELVCAGLANLVLEPDVVPSLMKHEIVRRVGPLILDKEERVQEAATGILRNLTVSSEPSICQMMIDQDVMTPVIFFIKKFSESLLNSDETSDVIKQQASVHEQVMHLLLNLCENSSNTIKIANEACIIPILTTFLNADVHILPIENVLVTAQCLCTITEDNPPAGEALANSKNSVSILEKLLLCDGENRELMSVRVLCAGTLFNIYQSLPSHNAFEMFQAIASVFAKVLDNDILQCAEHLYEQIKANEESQTVNGSSESGEHSEEKRVDPTDQEIQKFRQLLEAQKITLEILTNMCCSDESSDQDWEDNSSSDDVEEDCSVRQDMDVDTVSSCLSEEIMTSVVSHQLPKKVLQKCCFVNFDDGVMAKESVAGCRKIIETIQTRALVCLNNILSTIDIDQLGGAEEMSQLWTKIIDIAFENNGSASGFTRSDDEFVEAASCALRSILEKVASTKTECITAEQVNLLCHLSCVVKFEPARVNLMNVLGIVGKITTGSSADAKEPLQCIGTVLRDVVISCESLWVIAEALDAIFDIFADSPVADIAASNIGLLPHLEKSLSVLKSRVRKEKHTLGDRISIVNTAKTNLVRFLKYKKQNS